MLIKFYLGNQKWLGRPCFPPQCFSSQRALLITVQQPLTYITFTTHSYHTPHFTFKQIQEAPLRSILRHFLHGHLWSIYGLAKVSYRHLPANLG